MNRHRWTELCRELVAITAVLVIATGVASKAQARTPNTLEADRAEKSVPRRTYRIAAALSALQRRSPSLVAARQRARGLASASGLTARFANPSVDYEQELMFPLATQETVKLTLPIPLGGRFKRLRELARRRARVAQARTRQLYATGGIAFARRYFRLLRLHRLLGLRQKSLAEHRDLARRMQARAAGGGLAGVVATRLSLEVKRRAFALEQLRERTDRLGRHLALALGDRRRILVPAGPLLPPAPPSLASLRPRQRASGIARLLGSLVAVHRAEERLARARRWPDLGLTVGYQRQQAPAPDRQISHGVVFGISLPLPFFSTNRRAVQLAQVRRRSAVHRAQVFRHNSRVLLRDARARTVRARKRHQRYRRQVLQKVPALVTSMRVAFDTGGVLANLLERLAAVSRLREGGLDLGLRARLQSLRMHELAGTLPRR